MPKNPNAERDNPCLKEQNLTYKCLNSTNFDREQCEVYFVNYNSCKEFWNKVRLDRKRKGIIPNMPDVEDRPVIKEQYLKNRRK